MNKKCPNCFRKIEEENIFETGDAYCKNWKKHFVSELLSEFDVHFIKTVVLVTIILGIISLILFALNSI